MDAGRHPLIEVMTNTELVGLEGKAGEFRARLRKNPRYVREDRCVACGQCAEACPQIGGNEFDLGLKARKAIYRPFPQSVPSAYVIDRNACMNFLGFLSEPQLKRLRKVQDFKKRKPPPPERPANMLVCGHCAKVCDVDAIDFDMPPEETIREVGSVLVAVGFQEFDARALGNYGYGRFQNVVTSLELERMLNASGVTRGHVVRPSDMKTPKRIVFVQCVGARGEGGRPYCSRFCCMNAVKDSMLIRQHDPEVETVTILYTDLRAFGKGFDDFVQRSRDEHSAIYLRGRPAKIERIPEDDTLMIFVEDTLEHQPRRLPADLVVLSIAAAPNEGALELARILGIETDAYGFVARRDPAISAVETTREGIFVCGSAVGPQVIPDCVAQASAAAARAELFLCGQRVKEPSAAVQPLDLSGPPRVGVMICHCGVNIAGVLDVEELAKYAATIPNVVVAKTHLFSCSATGQGELIDLIGEHGLNRVVVAACTPRTHEPIFQETLARVGFNPYLFEMVNIRDQCSWVHAKSRREAQAKARALIRMGVARVHYLAPLVEGKSPMTPAALVIGGGIAGIEAATDLAVQGFAVTLVEKESRLGGRLAEPNLKYLYPNMRLAAEVLEQKLERLEASGAKVLLNTEVEKIAGFVGNFEVTLVKRSRDRLPSRPPHPGPLPRGEGEQSDAHRQAQPVGLADVPAALYPPPEGEGQGEGELDVQQPGDVAAPMDPTATGPREEKIFVGAIILATGASLYEPQNEFGYGAFPNVLTSAELERLFSEGRGAEAAANGRRAAPAAASLPPVPADNSETQVVAGAAAGRNGPRSTDSRGVRGPRTGSAENGGAITIDGRRPRSAAFILCVGSRDPKGFTGCSRYCCPTAIKQAIQLCRQGIDTTIFYRDIRTISTGAEEMYRQARGMGVLFVRIPPGEKPEVIGNGRAEAVRCYDELLGRRLEVPADLVVLSVGMRPRQPETAKFHEMLKISLGLDGFFLERHPELAPVETSVEGIFVAGTVQGPKDIVDSVAQASAAAAKASVLLAHDQVKLHPAVAVVDEVKCRACGQCVEICQFQAPQIVEVTPGVFAARINPSLCKGCGTCAAWCPSGAITARHFTDRQVRAMIDAVFTEEEMAPAISD
ncbi:MAG: CoB--CoM heterodisulfide reductase iron-sulfur subunit A family protein [Verrucomicrobia bacterium]|nr:CoB--CoM heterodisulfide reductase iron-sulfur subunit A family protein [Verrucomicrobiota bacterium]